jgi:hypothetical protein
MPFNVDGTSPLFMNNPGNSNKSIPLFNVRLNNVSYGNNWNYRGFAECTDDSYMSLNALGVSNTCTYVLIRFSYDDGYEHGDFALSFFNGSTYGYLYFDVTEGFHEVCLYFDRDYFPSGRLMYKHWIDNVLQGSDVWVDTPRNTMNLSYISIGSANLYLGDYSYSRGGSVYDG